ncbi:MAG: DEAD/DEAH box helicase [Rhodospirillaceae bacterium]|nr:DEAD/DEAH box helicase [Rhodospirillaceae bacterium]
MTNLSTFTDLGVDEPIRRVLAARGYDTPTPIQVRAIPLLLDGEDVIGIAQTGTGKTAAFALPIVQQLSLGQRRREARALILAPTRELAAQIADSFAAYGKNSGLRVSVIFGGVPQRRQTDRLRRGVDIVVATPGRLLDLVAQGHLDLGFVEHLVLDEADRMLDMGFIPDVRKIIRALPRDRQSLLFSATMPPEVTRLAREILHEPTRIDIAPKAVTVAAIRQTVHFVEGPGKFGLLCDLMADESFSRVIAFTRTKRRADRVAKQLAKAGIACEAIHGDKAQNARQRALESFRQGRVRVLVATDIAARGIDVTGVSHVVNFDLPNEAEVYVHRIGRTARAGAGGAAISFCDSSERDYLRAINALIRKPIAVEGGTMPPRVAAPESPRGGKPAGPRRRNNRPRRRGDHANRAA